MCIFALHILMFLGCGGPLLVGSPRENDSGDSSASGTDDTGTWVEIPADQWHDTEAVDGGGESVDLDGDGWSDDLDCNDLDARIHPGAPEFCDGIDTDCDGVIDPNNAVDAEVWFRDLDGDGYGNPDDTVHSCSHPGDPFVAQGGDCDDTMEMVHPGAVEVLDGIDNDCDGRVDSGPLIGVWAWL